MPVKPQLCTCERCGIAFMSKNQKITPQRFCSIQCSAWGRYKPSEVPKRRRQKMALCLSCGTQFPTGQSASEVAKGSGKYCSLRCKGIASRLAQRPCETCGTIFQPAFNTSKRFCTTACKHIARRTGEDRLCEECGLKFYAHRVHIDQGQGRFCSIQCHNRVLTRYNASRGTFISGPERTTAMLLESLNISFIPQAMIDHMVCDFLIPDCRLIIEVDGDYWHGHPIRFPNPSPQQMDQRARDRRRDWFLRRHGFGILRIWESDLKHVSHVVSAILQKIQRRRAALIPDTTTPVAQEINPSVV